MRVKSYDTARALIGSAPLKKTPTKPTVAEVTTKKEYGLVVQAQDPAEEKKAEELVAQAQDTAEEKKAEEQVATPAEEKQATAETEVKEETPKKKTRRSTKAAKGN